MKLRTKVITGVLAGCLALIVAASVLPACSAGQTARDKIMEPALLGIAADIRADAERGALATDAPVEDEAIDLLFAAIETQDHEMAQIPVRVYWNRVRTLAYAGIADRLAAGEIGPMGAQSFEVRVDEYGAALYRWIGD